MKRVFALSFILLSVSLLFAQDETPTKVTVQNRIGDLPFSSSIGSGIEHVDLASGNLNIEIPLISRPGRGLDANVSLRYNSKFLVVAQRVDNFTPPEGEIAEPVLREYWKKELRPEMALGWTFNAPAATKGVAKFKCFPQGIDFTQQNVSFIYQDGSGAKHPFVVQDAYNQASSCQINDTFGPDTLGHGAWGNLTAPYSSFLFSRGDGSKISAGFQNGSMQYSSGPLADTNGNEIFPGICPVDTLGRTVCTFTQDPSATNLWHLTSTDVNGNPQIYTFHFGGVSLHTGFDLWDGGVQVTDIDTPGPFNTLTQIDLPNGTHYSFEYEPDTYGELTKIILPTGATISYTYATAVSSQKSKSFRYVSSRAEADNGVSHTWNVLLSSVSPDGFTATVTDPLGNQSVYINDSGAIVTATTYEGNISSTFKRKVNITYACDTDPLYQENTSDFPQLDLQPSCVGQRPTVVTIIRDDGSVSKREFDYDSFTYQYHPPSNGVVGPATTFTTSRGNILEIREYDWGQGAPGALLRRTDFTYAHDQNSALLAANIVDKVARQTIYDAAGNKVAETLYEYDSTPLIPTGGAPGHDNTNYGPSMLTRGNPTKVKVWRNTDNTYLTTTYSFDDLGNLRTITDPLSHATNWYYDDQWQQSTCAPTSNAFAYVTKKVDALGHETHITRYSCTGQVANHRDQNDINAAGPGSAYTYDTMGRPIAQILPDGGESDFSYQDDPAYPLYTRKSVKRDSTPAHNIVSTTYTDGFGRSKQSILDSDPDGAI